ncbi:MAG: MerR family transcriptional regulator [Deltaproteobacteria bacterium]|nr:MAG: MerR family transcriptional regulator [Deltaproteobacteria bacterium]
MSYWIKTVADMTGIPKNTLIAWERRYGLISPRRTDAGYRVYSEADLAVLRRVKALLDAGHRISEAASIIQQQPGVAEAEPDGVAPVRRAIRDALYVFDRRAADAAAAAAVSLPFETRVHELLLPMLVEVGDAWENGEISVAQEHFASAWCREQMLSMARALEAGRAGAREAICATPPGEQHEFGLLGAAFWLASAGYRITYLGADVPEADLLALVAERQPAVVALSAVREREDLDLGAFAERVHAAAPGSRVLLGGRAATTLPASANPNIVFGAARADV